jgi:hypothetical protein
MFYLDRLYLLLGKLVLPSSAGPAAGAGSTWLDGLQLEKLVLPG